MAVMKPSRPPSPRVANRYGTPKPGWPAGVRRWVLLAVLGAAVVVVGIFSFTSGSPRIVSKDVGFAISGPTSARVDFDVTKPAADTVQCAVQVLSEDYAVVGWKVVTIGPMTAADGVSDGRTTAHQVELRTDSPGVSGGVRECWLLTD